jgi:hypothetical protein
MKPSISSAIIRQIPQGANLESTGKEGEWYLVKLEPDEQGLISGYVHESLVQALSPVPQEERIERKIKPEKIEKPPEPAPVKEEEAPPPPKTLPEGRLSLAVTAGGSYVSYGDINKGVEGLADYYSDVLGIEGDKKTTPVHLSYLFGGDISYLLAPRLFLSLGVDFFGSKKESLVTYKRGSISSRLFTQPEVKAIPVKLALSYYPVPYLYFKLGICYVFSKCAYFYSFEKDNIWREWRGEATGKNIGLLGAAGAEWSLAPNFALIVEISNQLAVLKGFKGMGTIEASDADKVEEEGKLYLYDVTTTSNNTYPILMISAKVPTGGFIENAREAQIDLMGIALRAGLRIRF